MIIILLLLHLVLFGLGVGSQPYIHEDLRQRLEWNRKQTRPSVG